MRVKCFFSLFYKKIKIKTVPWLDEIGVSSRKLRNSDLPFLEQPKWVDDHGHPKHVDQKVDHSYWFLHLTSYTTCHFSSIFCPVVIWPEPAFLVISHRLSFFLFLFLFQFFWNRLGWQKLEVRQIKLFNSFSYLTFKYRSKSTSCVTIIASKFSFIAFTSHP